MSRWSNLVELSTPRVNADVPPVSNHRPRSVSHAHPFPCLQLSSSTKSTSETPIASPQTSMLGSKAASSSSPEIRSARLLSREPSDAEIRQRFTAMVKKYVVWQIPGESLSIIKGLTVDFMWSVNQLDSVGNKLAVENALRSRGLWETGQDPAILYAGTKDQSRKIRQEGKVSGPRNHNGISEESRLERQDFIIEELLVKMKELAPHIDEVSRRQGVYERTMELAGNIEDSRRAWEEARLRGLRYIDGSPIRDATAPVMTPDERVTGLTKTSQESAQNPGRIEILILIDDLEYPGKTTDWPIYLTVISLTHDPPLIRVDFPNGFPYPLASPDGSYKLKPKHPEMVPAGLQQDNTIIISGGSSDDNSTVGSQKGPGVLITAFRPRLRAESFPHAQSPKHMTDPEQNSEELDDSSRRLQTLSCPNPPRLEYPVTPARQLILRPRPSLKSHAQATNRAQAITSQLPSTATLLSDSQSQYQDASTQTNMPIHPWYVPLPPSPEHVYFAQSPLPSILNAQIPASPVDLQDVPIESTREFENVNSSPAQQKPLSPRSDRKHRKILGTLEHGIQAKFKPSQRVSSDSIRTLADTIWDSPKSKNFSSKEEVLSQLQKAPVSLEMYHKTMQRYLPPRGPRNGDSEGGRTNFHRNRGNWRDPAPPPPVNKKHRRDVRNVFLNVFEDSTTAPGPGRLYTHTQRTWNNENRRLSTGDASGSVEEYNILEHFQTLREKGRLEELWRLQQALERSLSDEKENLQPIRQPVQPVIGVRGFNNRASLKRPVVDDDENENPPCRISRDDRSSRPGTDESSDTVVKRPEEKSNDVFSGETLLGHKSEKNQYPDSETYGVATPEDTGFPGVYGPSKTLHMSLRAQIPQQAPVYFHHTLPRVGEPVYVHNSMRCQELPIPTYSGVYDSALVEPVYFHDPYLQFRPYSQVDGVPFQTAYNPVPQSLEDSRTPLIVDGQYYSHPQVEHVKSFFPPVHHSAVYPQPSTYFTQNEGFSVPPLPPPYAWAGSSIPSYPIMPTDSYMASASPLIDSYTTSAPPPIDSGPHVLCHRLRKDKAEKVLNDFKKKYPITGKDLFKESLAHQNSLRKSRGKAKGRDAATIQQDLEMMLLLKREKMNREMARGRRNGVGISVRIKKPGEEMRFGDENA